MEITYVGHACFVIRFDTGLTVCFDPYAHGSVPGLSDVLALQLYILVIGKTDFKHETLPPFSKNYIAKVGNLMLQNSITVKFLKAP